MSLIIEQGPLPFDGNSVDPARFLEDWVTQTNIFGLGPGAFKGGVHQFIISSTEPPPEQDREQGLLWFKRGEGVLYIWDKPDTPSGLTYARTNWIGIGGRRDIWVYSKQALPAFAPVYITSSLSGVDFQRSQTEPNRVYQRWLWPVAGSLGMVADACLEVQFILLETTISENLVRAVEWGFTSGLMHSGETGNAGPLMISDASWVSGPGGTPFSTFFPPQCAFLRLDPTYATNPGLMYTAHAVGSSATNPGTYWLQKIFKRPLPPIGNSLKA